MSARVVFCGVGAIGSSAAVLCRNLDATLVVVDFDRVESKNLLAQAFVKQSVGRNKADALKAQLLNFFGLKVEAVGVKVVKENVAQVVGDASLVVDCFDNAAGRRVLSEHCRERGIALVHAALSGDGRFGMVRWDERFTPDAEDVPGQATCEGGEFLPFIGLLSAALARVIQDHLADGSRRDVMVSLHAVTPA